MKLQDFRAKLPQLNGLDDESALNVLHKVYYPTVDKARMAEVLGVKMTPVAEPAAEERSLPRAAADTALQFGRGAVSGVRMMSDLFGANNAVSGSLKSAEDAISGLLSAQAQGDQQKIAQIMAEADNMGWKDQIVAGLKAFGVAPGAILAQAAGTSLPTLATALIPGAGAAAAATRLGMGAVIGAGQGAGAVKGQIYETVKTELLKSGATPEVAEARAQEAQAYDGANAGQIAVGGGLGLVAGTTGAERMLGALRNGVTKAAPGMVGRVGMGALTEALPEAAQGGQEKFAANTALVNEGYGIDPMRGVVAGATMEGVAGAGMGGAFALPNPTVQTNPAVDDPKKKVADAIRATEKVPETGVLTKAVNAGTEAKAQRVEAGATAVTAADVTQAAQKRLAALELKSKGTKDQTITGPEGEKVNVPGQPGEFFTADEKAEYDWLRANIDNPQALAQKYNLEIASPEAEAAAVAAPPAVEPPAAIPPAPVAPADPPVMPVSEASPEDQALYAQMAEDDARARAEAEMERLAIQSEGQFVASQDDDSDIPGFDPATDTLNPAGKPFKTKMAADREAKAQGGEVVPVEGGFIVRKTQDGKPAEAPAVAAPVAQADTPAPAAVEQLQGADAGSTQPVAPADAGQPQPVEALTTNVQDQPQGTATAAAAPAPAEAVQAPPAVGSDGTAQPGAAPAGNPSVEADGVAPAAESEKAKWIKATIDKSRLNGANGVQIAVAPNGGVTFLGDPNSSKDGKALLANYQQALAAGATQKEIAEALNAAKSAPTPSPNTTEPTNGTQATQAQQAETQGQQAPAADAAVTEPPDAGQDEAGANWNRMTTVEREAVALRTGIKGVAAKNVATRGWQGLDRVVQERLAKAMANPKAPAAAPVSSQFTGEPDQKNSAPTQELDGFKVGDAVDIPSRTFGVGKIETLFKREMAGFGPMGMARVVRDDGKKLDVLTSELKAVAAPAPAPAQENPSMVEFLKALTEARKELPAGFEIQSEGKTIALKEDGRFAVTGISRTAAGVQEALRQAKLRAEQKESETQAAAEPKGPYATWRDSTFAERRELLRAAGYTDTDQNRVLSGTDWSNLTDPVRNALSGKSPKPVTVTPAGAGATAIVIDPGATRAQADPDAAAKAKAQADLDAALGDLGDIFGKNTRASITPEQEQKLLPVLTRVMDAAFRLGYYKFKDAARFVIDTIRSKMGNDVADQITLDHLQGAYIGMAGKYQDQGASTKKEVVAVESLADLNTAAKPSLYTAEGRAAIAQMVADHLIGDGKFASINDARKFITEKTGEGIPPGTKQAKMADETVELGVVMAAREIVQAARKQGRSDEIIYDRLVNLYNAQPNLAVRDSTSIRNQAYSTPVPMAFVASRLAGIKPGMKVGELTAGNGALMIEVDPKDAVVNELNPDRMEALRSQGFNPTNEDATTLKVPAKSLDAINMNPPFGALDGKRWDIGGLETGEIDHAIVMKSLEALKDDGSAVFIIGGVNARETEARRQAYRGKAKREFFATLYGAYNVVDHFTLDGGMYSRQGAGFPVDVLVIRGRGKSKRMLPAATPPKFIENYDQLKEKLNEDYGGVEPAASAPGVRSDSNSGGVAPDAGGVPVAPVGASGLPVQGGGQVRPQGGNGASDGGRADLGAAGPRGNEPRPANPADGASAANPQAQAGAVNAEGGPGNQDQRQGSGAGPAGGQSAGLGADAVGKRTTDRQGVNEAAEAGKLQVKYESFSKNKSVNTLVATNHLTAIENAFQNLRSRVGDVDAFVRKELDYEPEQFKKAFSAEQVEALALAIDNIRQGKGFIIGDQTGIGKGRVVAAMIRYAKINGKTPVFVTQMPDLYGDMMRDLNDIGMSNIRPLMTNNNASVPLDAEALAWFGEVQAIKSRVDELTDEVNSILQEDHAEKIKALEPKDVDKELRNLAKMSTNPEVISLRQEIAELNESKPAKRGKFLDTPNIDAHEKMLADMVNADNIGDYDVIFTTYTQMDPLDSGRPKRDKITGQKTPKAPPKFGYRDTFLTHFINNNAMLILDESHNAGAKGDGKFPSRGDIVRKFIANSGSVFYSSATFAKNPEVMDAYSKTDLGKAFGNSEELTETVSNVPIQQVTSTMLVEAGQYLRRERSFDGIEYDSGTVEVDQQAAEDVSTAMRLIVAFDKAKKGAIKDIQNDLDQEGAAISALDGGASTASVDSVNFTSVMHNVINTFLLALKSDAAADAAVQAIRNGEKPVLTVANTMEMFITEYAKEAGITIGDKLDATFADVLKRYLEKTRYAMIRRPGGSDEKVYLSDEQLGPDGLEAYNLALEFIEDMELNIPLSPIDHIKAKIEEAGFSIGEITGRQTVVVGGVLRQRNKAEMNTAGKKNTIAKFNNGQLDALIINRSGSTGLSMHASETFADQRRRVMVIAQAELDINNHMQMLGRVNRTGQVTANGKSPAANAMFGLPRYVQLSANVPIEMRPAAVLANKMANLNANTTAGRKSAVEAKNVPDFMNKYGDRVAAELVGTNPELNERLGYPLKPNDDGEIVSDGAMAKVTGRIGLLPLKQQSELYEALASEYQDLIAQLEALGQNELEAKTYPLDAKTLEKRQVMKADSGPQSPFTQAVFAETVSMRKLGRPYPKAKVQEMVAASLGGKTASDVYRETLTAVQGQIDKEVNDLERQLSTADPKNVGGIEKQITALKAAKVRFREMLPGIGMPYVLKTENGNIYGVVTAIEKKGKAKSAGSLSAWKIKFAVVDGARSMTIPMTQLANASDKASANAIEIAPAPEMTVPNADRTGFDTVPVMEAFDRGQTDARETRIMITGNILRGYGALRGRLMNYTDDQGNIRQGILMPADKDMDDIAGRFTPSLKTAQDMIDFLNKGGVLIDKDSVGATLKVTMSGSRIRLETSKTGLGKKLVKEAKDVYFASSGSKMVANLYDEAEFAEFIEGPVAALRLTMIPNAKTVGLLRGDDDADGVAFSRAQAPAKGIPVQTAQQIVDAIAQRWDNAPQVVVLADMNDPRVPAAVRQRDAAQRSGGAKGAPEGFFYKGTAYVVAGSLKTPADVVRVLFHESLGHYGLRGVFGDSLTPILKQIAALRKAEVQAKADEYGLDMTKESERLQAAEEVLAVMAQTSPDLGYVKRAVAAVRAWLRKTMPKLFGQMKLTDDEIVQQFILPARRFVQSGPGGGPRGGLPAMSRAAETASAAFRKWFGDSKVVDADGKPLVVYHGTRFDFANFEGYEVAGWFSATPDLANERYAFGQSDDAGANVMPVYLSIKNPKVLDSDMDDAGADGSPMFEQINNAEYVAELIQQGYDGIVVNEDGRRTYAAFRPTQIKSAIGNNGQFDPENPDIRFSRSLPEALAQGVNNVRDLKLPAGYVVNDFFQSTGKLSWWHKTIGTQYNLAQRSKPFKRVFDTAQEFINDVSYYATEAADKAQTILPKLETWRDITKSPLSAADNKAIAAPIFEGTLVWVRGEDGKPIKVEELREKAATIPVEKKAQQLVRDNKLSASVLRMWQGLPIAQYEALIESRYESQVLGQPGIVFTTAELKSMFGLNDKQVGLYREFRAAVDTSLKNMALADMVRMAGKDAAPVAEVIMGARTVGQAADTLRAYLLSLVDLEPGRKKTLEGLADKVLEKAAKVKELMDRGYAPLSRFGSNSLDVVDENGDRVYFGLFESTAEANKMARQMLEQFPGAQIRQGTMSGEEFKLFAGVSPETVELFGEMLGLDATGDEAKDLAFQNYLKLSKASRSAMKRLIHRKGVAGFSEDPGRVLAGFVYSNARQTSASLHMGELTEAVNEIPQGSGELKDAAVRLHDYVKNPQEEAQAIRGLLFAQYLGGSIASALVNMTQPVNVTLPWLSQFGGATKAGAQMARAMKDVLKKSTGDKALDEALKKAEEDGTVSPQEVFQLQAQAAGRASLKAGDGTMAGDLAAKGGNALSKLGLAWGKLFSAAEQFNRRTTFIAAYRTAVAQKLGNPGEFARKAVYETQFIYSKANKPRWARGAVGGTLFTFKQYSIAYVELLHRMATQGGPEGKRAALLALGVLMVLSGVGGLPFAGDVDDLVDGVMQRLGYNFSSEQAKTEFFERILGQAGAQIAMRGISGVAGVPIDISGRLGMSNLLPGTGLLTKKDNYSTDLAEVLGPAGDLAKRAFQATEQALSGEVGKAAVTISPLAARNVAKAVEMGQTGMYLDTRGKKVIDTTTGEALVKAVGFQPNDVARVQNANWNAQRMVAAARLREREIADKWAKGVFLSDPAMVQEAREALTEWNRKNPESPIKIKMPQIVKRVREMRTSKSERIAKSAPKEIRAQVKEVLAEAER